MHRAITFLIIASASITAEAFFTAPTKTVQPKTKSMPDITATDDDGKVVRIPVKNIERDWTWGDDYKAEGEFSVDLFVPEDGKVKGCAFFMHGFSQYPVAYRKTLKAACEKSKVAIIACETGLLSDIVKRDAKSVSLFEKKDKQQFFLQRALSQDTKQCIKMVLEGSEVFAEYGITKRNVGNRIAVMGHSMGGGLSFPVAADFPQIDYVFTMAPAAGKPEFDPITKGVEERTPSNTMLLAGNWDLIAKKSKIKSISAAANALKKDSSVLVSIDRGIHTGFEDKLVLFNFDPSALSVSLVLSFFIDSTILAAVKLLNVLRKSTGQLDGSEALMEYVLLSMAEGKKINTVDAEKYLDDNIKDRFEDKFNFEYGSN